MYVIYIYIFIYLTFGGPCIVIYSYNKSQEYAQFLNFILVHNSKYQNNVEKLCILLAFIVRIKYIPFKLSGSSFVRGSDRK